MPTEEEVKDLADAMWQLLDDMGKARHSVCMLAKVDARIAFEPFRDKSEPDGLGGVSTTHIGEYEDN